MSKSLLIKIALVCVAASVAMFVIGSNDSKLTELKDFFWAPLPLAFIAGSAAARARS